MRGGIEPPTIGVWFRRSTNLNYLIDSSLFSEEIFFVIQRGISIRLRRGLPWYLILFAPHAFAPQCQIQTRRLPSHLIFLLISKNLTSPLEILSSSFDLKIKCIDCKPNANNWNGTINNNYPPTCPLRPIILNNTCSSCLTAPSGTEFAGASLWR